MITLFRYFSPFYDFARRKLGINPSTVDSFLVPYASARIDGRQVVLTDPRGAEHRAFMRYGHARHTTRWVNEFNSRVPRDSDSQYMS